MPAADISEDVATNNGQDDTNLSDTGEDPGGDALLYTIEEKV